MTAHACRNRCDLAAACVVALGADVAIAQCSADRLDYPFQQETAAWFGSSVAASHDLVIVGAAGHVAGEFIGAAFVYRREGPLSWQLEQQLAADDGEAFDFFGGAVAANGDVVIVGASGADGAQPDAGAAYVFRFDGASWTLEQKLTASDGKEADGFGLADASADLIVVGAATADPHGSNSGAAYVFRSQGGSWVEEQRLVPNAPGPDMYLGRAIATDGTRIAVSAIGHDGFAGAVLVFEQVAGQWEETHFILSPDHAEGAVFGSDIALDGDRLLVGAPGESSQGTEQAGAAYVFVLDQGTNMWIPETKLTPIGRQDLDNYGSSVAMRGSLALVGKNPHVLSEPAPPALFVWNGEWAQHGELRGFFESGEAIFGGAVALSEDTGIVGSRRDIDDDVLPGAAYVFTMQACVCAADFNGDDAVDTRDVLAYLNAWAAEHPGADVLHDGEIDIRDFLAFLNLWTAGC